MSMLCPQCLGTMVSDDGVNAVCTVDGTQYQIVYARDVVATETNQELSVAADPYDTAAAQYAQPVSYETAPPLAPPPPPVAAIMCKVHPQMPAVAYCRSCGAPACETCNFAMPYGLNLCAACAAKPPVIYTPKRKQLMGWAYGLAVWCFVGYALLFTGVFRPKTRDDANELGCAMMAFIFLPSIVGTALAWSAMDKRRGNTGWLWGAAIANSVAVLIFLLIMLIGTMHG